MPLESGTYISDLVPTNPAHSDSLSQTDAHIRLLKQLIKATFPNINGVVNITDEQLNEYAAHTIAGLEIDGDLALGGNLNCFGRVTGNGSVPTGAIVDFLTPIPPTGWYELNGQAVPRTGATAGLFTIYATNYGPGDGSTTFNLPDLRDRFRRARGTWDVATFQADAIKTHSVSVSVSGGDHSHTGSVSGSVTTTLTGAGSVIHNDAGTLIGGVFSGSNLYVGSVTASSSFSGSITVDTSGALSFSASGSYSGDTETRPKAVTVVTCVKA